MTRFEFYKHAVNQVREGLPEYVKKVGIMAIDAEIKKAVGLPIIQNEEYDKKIYQSLKNHFDKLIDDLKNTSNKKMVIKSPIAEVESLKPIDQQFEVYKAIKEFLKITAFRNNHGIRNAYISFTRQRRQIMVKGKDNIDGLRKGRPNLYNREVYRYVVNRAVKIKKAKNRIK